MKKRFIHEHIRRKLSLVLILVLSVLMISCGQKETDVTAEESSSGQEIEKTAETAETQDAVTAEEEDLRDYECQEELDASTNVSGTEIPQEKALMDLLIRYWTYIGGETEFDASTEQSAENIMAAILETNLVSNPYPVLGYKGFTIDDSDLDPREWWDHGFSIAITTKETADWCATFIYNISQENLQAAIDALEEKHIAYPYKHVHEYEGEDMSWESYYSYFDSEMATNPPVIQINNVKQYGNMYYLSFGASADGKQPVDTFAVAEYKEFEDFIEEGHSQLEGQYFWSLHYFGWNKPSQLD